MFGACPPNLLPLSNESCVDALIQRPTFGKKKPPLLFSLLDFYFSDDSSPYFFSVSSDRGSFFFLSEGQ